MGLVKALQKFWRCHEMLLKVGTVPFGKVWQASCLLDNTGDISRITILGKKDVLI